MKLDTGNSVQKMQKLDKETQALNKDLNTLSNTAEQDLGTAIKDVEAQMEKLAMAGKRNTQEYKALGAELSRLQGIFSAVESDIKVMGVNMNDVSGSISAMEDRLYTLAATGGKNSQEFKDLSAELVRLKTVQREVDAVIDQSAISMDDTSAAIGLMEDRLYRLGIQGKQNTKEYKELVAQIAKYKTVLLDADMAVDGNIISTNDLSGSVGKLEDKLYAMQAQGQRNTKEFKQTAQQLIEYKRQLQGVDMQIDAMMQGGMRLNTALSIGNTAVAGMTGFENAMKLAGVESESLTKAMMKMQQAVAVLTAVQQVSVAFQRQGLIMTALTTTAEKIKNFVLTGQFAAIEANVAATGEKVAVDGVDVAVTGGQTAANQAEAASELEAAGAKQANVAATGEKIVAGTVDTAVTGGQAVATEGLAGANVMNATATTGATLATKALRIALIATGIGAIVVGVGLLAANWDKVSAALTAAYDWFNKLGPTMKIIVGSMAIMFSPIIAMIYGVIKALEFFGIIDDEQTRKTKANAEKRTKERDKELKKEASNIKARGAKIQASYDFEIRMAQAAGKSTVELERKKLVAMINTTKQLKVNLQQRMANYWQEIEMLRKLGDTDSDRYKKLTKQFKDARTEYRKNNTEYYKNVQDLKVSDAEAAQSAKEAAQERAEAARQAAADARQKEEDRRRAIIEINKAERDELLALEKEYQENLLALKEEGQEKEREQAVRAFNEWQSQFLEKSIQQELKAEEEKYAKGKISREQYEQNISNIRMSAIDNLTEEERKVLTSKQDVLNKDLSVIDKKYLEVKEQLAEDWANMQGDEFDKELREYKKTQDEKTKKLQAMLKANVITQDEYNAQVTQMAIDLNDKELQIIENRSEKYQALIRDKYDQELKDLENTQKVKEQTLVDGLQKGFLTEQQFNDAIAAMEEEYAAKSIEIEEKRAKEILDKKLEQVNAIMGNIQFFLEELETLNTAINERQNAQLENQKAADDQRLKDLEARKNAELANENLTAEQRKKIEQKYAMDAYKIQLAMYEREEKIKKSQFERDKAFKIANAITGTAMAIVKAIEQFGPPPSPLGIAAVATAATIGAAQIAAIAATKYQAGAAPAMPSLNASGGGGSMTGASASQFTVSQNTQGTDLTELMNGESGGKIPMTKVVVLESDITNVQNKVAAQEKLSTY